MRTPALILTLLLLAPTARADSDGLSYGVSEEVAAPATQDESRGSMSVIVSEDARDAFENPRERPQDIVKKGSPSRFDLENRARFRSWIQELCKLEPVNLEESGRARIVGKKKQLFTALNKQGSLQLLLENYIDDVKFEADCAQKQKTNPAACTDSARFLKFSGGLDSLRSLRSAKKSSDHAKLVKEKRLSRQKALKSEFYDLRDAGSLDGKSTEKAEAILRSLREESSCRTRSVAMSERSRSTAQK